MIKVLASILVAAACVLYATMALLHWKLEPCLVAVALSSFVAMLILKRSPERPQPPLDADDPKPFLNWRLKDFAYHLCIVIAGGLFTFVLLSDLDQNQAWAWAGAVFVTCILAGPLADAFKRAAKDIRKVKEVAKYYAELNSIRRL